MSEEKKKKKQKKKGRGRRRRGEEEEEKEKERKKRRGRRSEPEEEEEEDEGMQGLRRRGEAGQATVAERRSGEEAASCMASGMAGWVVVVRLSL